MNNDTVVMPSKFVFVDWGVFMFRSIFAGLKSERTVPPTYTAMTMIISCLKHVGITPSDTVIIAADSPKGSWRKEYDNAYKANRKEKREKYDINWTKSFEMFWALLEKLEMYTPFHTISIDKLEADDIIAYSCKHFSDKECVIISSDADYEQLFVYPNVKIFSPVSKHYKKPVDPYRVLAQKIQKETSDNLVTPILSERDFEIRNKIINLMSLPKEIEEKVHERIQVLPTKEWDYNRVPFQSLYDRYLKIYETDKIVDPNRHKKKIKKKKEVPEKTLL